jgi:hypothetical protein
MTRLRPRGLRRRTIAWTAAIAPCRNPLAAAALSSGVVVADGRLVPAPGGAASKAQRARASAPLGTAPGEGDLFASPRGPRARGAGPWPPHPRRRIGRTLVCPLPRCCGERSGAPEATLGRGAQCGSAGVPALVHPLLQRPSCFAVGRTAAAVSQGAGCGAQWRARGNAGMSAAYGSGRVPSSWSPLGRWPATPLALGTTGLQNASGHLDN